TSLDVLSEGDSWTKVRLADGQEGWVASRFVAQPQAARKLSKKKGCPVDSDFAFVETPTPRFSDSGAHGVVVVEANVNVSGKVTSTKVISNGTGDEALAFLAAKEIQSAKFSPPIRNCVARAFIFTYRRTF
ncbi:MAG TPA: TonB family protein, partial [Thermoanaerobaculia bacterium]